MKDITFKIAKKGEGKTKWLLEIAHKYDGLRKIYLYTGDATEYRKFCEKYFSTYSEICPVERLTAFKLTDKDVVLVDNLFNHDSAIGDFTFIQRNCYKMFITLEGINA